MEKGNLSVFHPWPLLALTTNVNQAKTDEFANVRREHPAVERKLNEILNHNAGRKARYWGTAKIRIQETRTVFAVNTKRIIKLLAPVRADNTNLAVSDQI